VEGFHPFLFTRGGRRKEQAALPREGRGREGRKEKRVSSSFWLHGKRGEKGKEKRREGIGAVDVPPQATDAEGKKGEKAKGRTTYFFLGGGEEKKDPRNGNFYPREKKKKVGFPPGSLGEGGSWIRLLLKGGCLCFPSFPFGARVDVISFLLNKSKKRPRKLYSI